MLATHNTSTLTPTSSRAESGGFHQELPAAASKIDHESASQEKNVNNEFEKQSPSGLKFALVMLAILASLFLVALDRTIVATAVPRITDQFHSLDDISWYAGAYLLTSCATQLSWGRIYTFYSTKIVFLTAVGIFEIGSALCGAAPNSIALIVGRAIAGAGSAGIFSGTSVIIVHIVPLARRPIYIGLMGSMFGISSIIGPLLGGAFTDHLSWRWCFYINLPIGAVTISIVMLFLEISHIHDSVPFWRQVVRLDPLGTILFLPGVTCFLLALQWGGTTYPWDNAHLVALFVLAGVLGIAFIAVQVSRQEDATIPPRIIKQRSIAFGTVLALLIGGGLVSMLYTLPLWFQSVKGANAVQSGVHTVPMVLALVAGAIIAGGMVTRAGYYVPWLFVATIFMAAGSGLITTFEAHTGPAKWIGYQVLFGIGIGTGMQQPNLAAQTVLERKDVSIGISLMFFAQSLGGAVFVAISQSLFTNHLASALPSVSNIDPRAILAAGATELVKVVPTDKMSEVLDIYNGALIRAFTVVVAVSSLMVLPALGMEWRTVKKSPPSRPAA